MYTGDITLGARRPMEMFSSKCPRFQQVSLSRCRCFCLKRRFHPATDQRLQDFRLASADRVIQNRQDKEALAKLVLLCSAWVSRKNGPTDALLSLLPTEVTFLICIDIGNWCHLILVCRAITLVCQQKVLSLNYIFHTFVQIFQITQDIWYGCRLSNFGHCCTCADSVLLALVILCSNKRAKPYQDQEDQASESQLWQTQTDSCVFLGTRCWL